jgi:predicted transcriptional regulator
MSQSKLPRIKNQTTREVYEIVTTSPYLTLQDITNLINCKNKSTAFYHLQKLMYIGDIAKTDHGRYISTRDKMFKKSNSQLIQELIIAQQEVKELKSIINEAKMTLTI